MNIFKIKTILVKNKPIIIVTKMFLTINISYKIKQKKQPKIKTQKNFFHVSFKNLRTTSSTKSRVVDFFV